MIEIMKKTQLLILITAFMSLFTGCVTKLVNDTEIDLQKFRVYDEIIMRVLVSPSENQDSITMIDLPNQLLIYRNFTESGGMFATTGIIFPVELTVETEFMISTEINIGTLCFGILNKDTDAFVFKYREMSTENVAITLEAGNYEFLLSGEMSNGTFKITSGNNISD